MSSPRALVAVVTAATLLAWMPATQAGTSFSFGIHGGDHFSRGHFVGKFHGKHYKHYGDHGYGYRIHRYYFSYPDRHRFRHYRPHWYSGYTPRWHWRTRPHAPRCIYSNGHKYCR